MMVLQVTAVRGYQVFLSQLVCQNRKPKMNRKFLSVLHIQVRIFIVHDQVNESHKVMALLHD